MKHFEHHIKTVRKIVRRFKGKTASIDSRLNDAEILRMAETTFKIPLAKDPNALLVDVGGSIFWVPIYTEILGYQKVIILCRPGGGQTAVFDRKEVGLGKSVHFEVLDCDAEWSKYPIDNGQASCVVSLELLEHFAGDPMHLISESNRILKDNEFFCLTTPNVISKANLANLALGLHPFGWSVFTDSYADRHNREYTPFEVREILEDGGFEIDLLETFSPRKIQSFRLKLLGNLLSFPGFLLGKVPLGMREGHMLVRGKKVGPVRQRYPKYLYDLYGSRKVHFKIPRTTIEKIRETS